ncbi:hypothetical protein ACFQZC_38570 [Streptacidiphilus monticola]
MTSSTPTGLHIAEDVEALIGPRHAAELRERLRDFTCLLCTQPGHPDRGAASLVIVAHGAFHSARFAHADCLPSCVVDAPDSNALPGAVELIPRAVGVPTPQGTRPVLLLAFEEELLLLDNRTDPSPRT